MLRVPKVGGEPAPAAGAPATSGDLDHLRFKLREPIKTHKGMTYELVLRQPRAADYIEIGRLPFDVRGENADRRAVIDFKLLGQWASRLTGHDEIVLGTLAANDWLDLAGRINSMLMQAGMDVLGGSVGNSDGSAAT